MNIILYTLKRFYQKSRKDKFDLIKCATLNRQTIKQVYKILKIRNNSRFLGTMFVNVSEIELGHDVDGTIRHVNSVIEMRKNAIFRRNRHVWNIDAIRMYLPSSSDIELYLDEDKNKYICLNGNGRVFSFQKVDMDIIIECRIYVKK